MIGQPVRGVAAGLLAAAVALVGGQSAGFTGARAGAARAGTHGPVGTPVIRRPGATSLMVIVDKSIISIAAVQPSGLKQLAEATFNYDGQGQLVPVPVLALGSASTPTVRAAIQTVKRLNPMQVYLLGMPVGQRLTIVTNVVSNGVGVFINANPGAITTLKELNDAIGAAAYYTPVLVPHTAGLRPATAIPSNLKIQVPEVKTPAAVDLSVGLPPVRDQGNENSCVGWSTSYYYKTWQEGQEHHWDVTKPDHQFSPAWVYNQINGGKDQGARFYDAMTLLTERGDVPLTIFPYLEGKYTLQPSKAMFAAADPYRAKSFGYLSLHTQDDPFPYNDPIVPLKRWLASGHPFVIGMNVFKSFLNYTGGVYDGPYTSDGRDPEGGHAMMVVGYDDNADGTGIGAFRLVNSWSTAWGEDGFGWVSYSYISHFVHDAWATQDDAPDTKPITLAAYPNPGPNGAVTRDLVYVVGGKYSLARHAARGDYLATITFEYLSGRGNRVKEDHLYTTTVEVPAHADITVTQNYRMDDGAVVTGQIELVTENQ